MKNLIYILGLLVLTLVACRTETNKEMPEGTTNQILVEEPQAVKITEVPYEVSVKNPVATNAYPTLHSFALGKHDGKWLMVGGRTNGFHRTSTPESTFPTKTSNANIWVLDHANKEVKSVPLPDDVKKHLRSTNMLFYQDGDWLYFLGGYGSNCDNDAPECYQTWPKLAALNVPSIINKVWNAEGKDTPDLKTDILTLEDENMRITGGGLKKIGDYFYAVFGQDYNSIYKGGVTGIYTEEVRRFKINNDGANLSIEDYEAYRDATASGVESEYHRRDLSVVSAIRADGSEGITVYGGVFTKNDGGWEHPIYVDEQSDGKAKVTVDTSLNQRLNQYECAHVLMFDLDTKAMYTTFLGGIGFYYFNQAGELVPSTENNWLPFVSSINTIVRSADGSSLESPQQPPKEMPGLLGSNAVFIPKKDIALYDNSKDILDYSKLPSGETMVGWMYGGIEASEPQASTINPTIASGKVYEVYVTKK